MGSAADQRRFIEAFDQAALAYLRKRMEQRQQKTAGDNVTQLEQELQEAHNELLSAFSDLAEYVVEQQEEADESVLSLVERDPADVAPFAMERALRLLKGEAEVGEL